MANANGNPEQFIFPAHDHWYVSVIQQLVIICGCSKRRIDGRASPTSVQWNPGRGPAHPVPGRDPGTLQRTCPQRVGSWDGVGVLLPLVSIKYYFVIINAFVT